MESPETSSFRAAQFGLEVSGKKRRNLEEELALLSRLPFGVDWKHLLLPFQRSLQIRKDFQDSVYRELESLGMSSD